MRRSILALLLSLLPLPALAEDIGSVGYRFKWLGPNDKIVVRSVRRSRRAGRHLLHVARAHRRHKRRHRAGRGSG